MVKTKNIYYIYNQSTLTFKQLWTEGTANRDNTLFGWNPNLFCSKLMKSVCTKCSLQMNLLLPDTFKCARFSCGNISHFDNKLRFLVGNLWKEMPLVVCVFLQFAAAHLRGILPDPVITFTHAWTPRWLNQNKHCDVTVNRRHSEPKITWPQHDPRRLVLVSPPIINVQLQQQQNF